MAGRAGPKKKRASAFCAPARDWSFAPPWRDVGRMRPALPCSSLRLPARRFHRLHAVGDGVVPEAIEALQRAVHLLEFIRVDAADLFDRADMALIEARHDFRHFGTLFRQADADRTAVDARALMVDEAEI